MVVSGWAVAAVAMLAVALLGVGDGNLFDRTSTSLPTVAGADSTFVYEYTKEHSADQTGPALSVIYQGVSPSDTALQARVTDAATEVAQRAGVVLVVTPFGVTPGAAFDPALVPGPEAPPLSNPYIGIDGTSTLISVTYLPFATPAEALAEHQEVEGILKAALPGTGSTEALPISIAYSDPLFFEDFNNQVERDLITGEAVALPVALLVMVLVFGGFLAASAPLIGALASIAGGLTVLFGFSYLVELDQSSINVVEVLGIGLSIDYGLLIVSRFREELAKAGDSRLHDVRAQVLHTTLATAGRTVFFSAITVAISVGGMLVFSSTLIRGIGGAALGVVVMALLSALTLVPAVLYLFGHTLAGQSVLSRVPGVRRILRHTADVSNETGFFHDLARVVQRRPWVVVGVTTAFLLILASPLTDMAVRNSGVELLPRGDETRRFVTAFDQNFPSLTSPDIHILADASPSELDEWLTTVTGVDGVARASKAEMLGDYASAGIYTDFTDQAGPEASALVRELRSLDAPFRVYVGDQAAIQIDFVDSLIQGAPWAIGLVVLATFVLLFLMTGSLLVPFKTLIINSLSLSAALGVVSWIFADGHLQGPLQFTSTGGVETYVLVMIIAFGFGLAMDYEVFLLARMKELVDEGLPNNLAVAKGLQRSGRIVTSAAAVIILVFLGFATGQVIVIKQVGIGLAVAVLLDATIVRMLLVPATMTLLGDWNWWAPAPLRRLYARARIDHS